VLGRTNRQLAVVAEKLDELGIKYSGTIRGSSGGRAKKDVLDYLTGLMYNEPEVVLRALFSPYSGVTWATAYEIKEKYKKGDMTFDDAKRAAKPFFEVKDEFTRDRIKEVFDTRILPVAVGISKEHFLIARAMYRSLEAYADKSEVGDRNSLFDYLRMSSEGYSPIGEGNGVLLATVHKAKSKWFDNVVYMPKYFGREAGFIDNAKYAIMKSAAGIDIVDRTKDEPIKIDFVAVTRAQNELYVVANHKQHPRFYIEGLVTEMPPKKIDIKPELQKARSALAAVSRESDEKDGYREIIFDHFKKNEHISFTRVTSLDKPYDYLLNYIIELQEKSSVMATGRDVHDMAEKFFRKTLAEASLTDGQRKFLDNIKEVYTTIAERMKGKQTDAEYSFDLDISEVFGKFKSGTVFTGKIDAVFEAETPKGKRYILVDYKTDKDGTWFDEHLKQVAVYKKAFAVKKRLNEDDIDVVVAYIGKNTGASSFGVEIHSSVPGKEMMTISKRVLDGKLEELKGDVARMIEYRADPEQFVKALLQTPKSQQDSRFKIIERTLMGERGVVIRDLERA
jgi:DNA helicase-2/ATP-dependent DNA helicase PcrA